MNYTDFAKAVKAKYPAYADVDDRKLAEAVVAKYPQYNYVSFEDEIVPAEHSKENKIDLSGAVAAGVEPVKKIADMLSRPVLPKQDTGNRNTEPILRARTAEDDQNLDYAKMEQLNNGTGGQVALTTEDIINMDRQGLEHSPIIEEALAPGRMIAKKYITKGGALLLGGLLQAKNYLSSAAQGKEFNPVEMENIATAIIPDNVSSVVKVIGGLAEMVADGIVLGRMEGLARNKFITNAVDVFENRMAKAGYSPDAIERSSNILKGRIIAREKGIQVKNSIGEPEKPMNIDEAAKLNIEARTAKIPKPEESMTEPDAVRPIEAEEIRPTEPERITAGEIEGGRAVKQAEPVETIKSVHEPAVKDTVQFTGKPFSKEQIKDLQKKYNYETGEFIPYDKNINEVLKTDMKDLKIDPESPGMVALYGETGVWTNGHILITDKKAAEKLGEKDKAALIKNEIKDILKRNKGMSEEIAKEIALNTYKEDVKANAVNWQQVIPAKENVTVTAKPAGIFFSRRYNTLPDFKDPVIMFRTDDGRYIFANYNYVSYLQKEMPNTKIYFNNNHTEHNPFVFKDKSGNIKAVVMPFKSYGFNRIVDRAEGISKDLREKLIERVDNMTDSQKIARYINDEFGVDIAPYLGVPANNDGYIPFFYKKMKMDNVEDFLVKLKGDYNISVTYNEDIAALGIRDNYMNVTNRIYRNLAREEKKKELQNSQADYLGMVEGSGKNIEVAENEIDTDYEREFPVDDSIEAPNTTEIDRVQLTAIPNMKRIPYYQAAKDGDIIAAQKLMEVLFDNPTPARANRIAEIKALAEKYPDAVLVPIACLEGESKKQNRIPRAFSKAISQITGLKEDLDIYQINTTSHTGATAVSRLFDKAVFDGKVVRGQKYIIVDDVFTMGGNINELRKYIIRQGGQVVGFEVVAADHGTAFAIDTNKVYDYNNIEGNIIDLLYSKFGQEGLDDFLQTAGYNSIRELSRRQAEFLLKKCSPDTLSDQSRNCKYERRRKKMQRISRQGLEKQGLEYRAKEVNKLNSLDDGEKAATQNNKEDHKESDFDLSVSSSKNNPLNSFTETSSEKNPPKIYQQLYDLAKKYGVVNIAESKYMPRRALGVFWRHAAGKGNIFVNSLNRLDVVTHEVTHAVDHANHLIDNLIVDTSREAQDIRAQLVQSARDNYPVVSLTREARLKEGLAMMIELSAIDPGYVQKRYPLAYEWAMNNSELKEMRDDARQIYIDYEGLDAVNKIKAQIYDTPLKPKTEKKIPLSAKFDTQFFDSEAVLRWLDEELYITAKGYKTILKGVIDANLTNKDGVMFILDKDGNPDKVAYDCNWRTLIQKVDDSNSDFNEYLVTRRFVSWYNKRDGFKNEIDKLTSELQKKEKDVLNATGEEQKRLLGEIAKANAKRNGLQAKYDDLVSVIRNHGKDEKTVRESYDKLNNDVNKELAADYDFLIKCNLDTMFNAKLIDHEMYAELIENEGYAPFNKVKFDELAGDAESVHKFAMRFANKNMVGSLKKIKGSELPIQAPLYSSVHLMAETYRKAYRQIINNKVLNIVDEYPKLMQVAPYSQGMEKNANVIIAKDATWKTRVVYMNSDVKKILEQISEVVKPNFFENLFLIPSRFFTNMTTGLYPLYAPTNFIRDQITAFVNSRQNYVPILSPIRQYISMLKNPDTKRFIKEYDDLFGVDNNTLLGTLKDIDPSDLGRAMRTSKLQNVVKLGTKLFTLPSNFTETLTRRTEYVKARLEGKDIKTAKRQADEITGAFGDSGIWFGRFGKVWIKANPYFNSALQVARQAVRSIKRKGNREKFFFVTAALAGLIVYGIKSVLDRVDDDDRQSLLQLASEQLAMYIYLPKKGEGLARIPIDQTYSFLGVIMTMIYMNSRGNDFTVADMIEAGTQFLPDQVNIFASLGKMIQDKDYSGLQKQAITSIPHMPKTILSGIFGKKTFPGITDIVPKSLQKREPALQYDDRTSNIAKFLGSVMNLSPMKIDYFIEQLGGRTVRQGMRVTESGYNYFAGNDNTANMQNLARLNPFVQSPYFTSGRMVQKFYEDKERFEQLKMNMKNGLRNVTAEEMKFMRENAGYIGSVSKMMDAYNKLVKMMRDERNEITEDKRGKLEQRKLMLEKMIFAAIERATDIKN